MDLDDPGNSEEEETEASEAQSKVEERLPMWSLHCHCGAWAFLRPCCAQVRVQQERVQDERWLEWRSKLASLRKEVKRLRKQIGSVAGDDKLKQAKSEADTGARKVSSKDVKSGGGGKLETKLEAGSGELKAKVDEAGNGMLKTEVEAKAGLEADTGGGGTVGPKRRARPRPKWRLTATT